jgi:NitT/TauT family transport system substrate-binding protein
MAIDLPMLFLGNAVFGLRRPAALFYGVMLALLLSACGAPPEPPVRVSVNPWVGYDPLVLARERNLLDSARIKVVELMSNSESQRALRNGLTEAAALTLDEALRLADSGVPLRIVALLSDSHGADAVLAHPDISTPAQLKGKRIALEETALGALVLDRLLAAGGLNRADISTLHVEAAMHADLLASGKVDAVITFEPMKSQLLGRDFRVIFDSRGMPGEIVDVLVARAHLSDERIETLRAAWEAGRQALLADPDGAASLLAPGADLTPAEYLATLQGLRFLTPDENAARLTSAALARDAGALANHLQARGLLRRVPDWSALTTARAAP